jgi:hypothetical protein
MPKERTKRQAYAVLERGKHSWIWVVPTCPYCGQCHTHYGGPLDGNPHRYLQWRARAYCNKADRQRWKQWNPTMTFSYILTTTPLSAPPRSRTHAETNLTHEAAHSRALPPIKERPAAAGKPQIPPA